MAAHRVKWSSLGDSSILAGSGLPCQYDSIRCPSPCWSKGSEAGGAFAQARRICTAKHSSSAFTYSAPYPCSASAGAIAAGNRETFTFTEGTGHPLSGTPSNSYFGCCCGGGRGAPLSQATVAANSTRRRGTLTGIASGMAGLPALLIGIDSSSAQSIHHSKAAESLSSPASRRSAARPSAPHHRPGVASSRVAPHLRRSPSSSGLASMSIGNRPTPMLPLGRRWTAQ